MTSSIGNSLWTIEKLFEIVEKQSVSELKVLQLHKKINFDIFHEDGFTLIQKCLFKCVQNNNYKLFHYLLNHHVNPLIPDRNLKRDVISWIIVLNLEAELINILIFMNGLIDFYSTDKDGNTYLHNAVMTGNIKLVVLIGDKMCKYSLDSNTANNDGLSPNMLAYYLGYLDIADVLETKYRSSKCRIDEIHFRTKTNISKDGLTQKKQERIKWLKEKTSYNKIFGLDQSSVKLPEIVENQHDSNKIAIKSDQSESFRQWCFLVNKPQPLKIFSTQDVCFKDYLPRYMKIYSKQTLPCYAKDKVYDKKSAEIYQAMYQRLFGDKIKRNPTRKSLRK